MRERLRDATQLGVVKSCFRKSSLGHSSGQAKDREGERERASAKEMCKGTRRQNRSPVDRIDVFAGVRTGFGS